MRRLACGFTSASCCDAPGLSVIQEQPTSDDRNAAQKEERKSLCHLFLFLRQGFFCVALAGLEFALLDQAGLELIDLPASASSVLESKARATMSSSRLLFMRQGLSLRTLGCFG